MRLFILPVLLILVAAAPSGFDVTTVSGTHAGKKLTFPEQSLDDGIKATIDLLESCHATSVGTPADLKNALRGDHIHIAFSRPIKLTRSKINVSEIVLTLPLNTGVFWLQSGDNIVRQTKYEADKEAAFEAWIKRAEPAGAP